MIYKTEDGKLRIDDMKMIDEILDVKWFDYDEIIDKADDELREASLKKAIMNQKNNFIAPMDIVDVLGI